MLALGGDDGGIPAGRGAGPQSRRQKRNGPVGAAALRCQPLLPPATWGCGCRCWQPLGILELAAPLEGWLRRRIFGGEGRLERFLASALACTLAATLFTMPLQAVFFGYFSLVSPLANLLQRRWRISPCLPPLAGSLLLPVLG